MEKTNNYIYYALIGTFFLLYLCIAFVSTLHAISFFQLANSMFLAILLGVAYEVGQASILFSILMTKNKSTVMAWVMMILLTTLQVTANVFASFMYIDKSTNNDWEYWQRSILFWVEADSPEMYKVIISWITGALLPIVALGMTKLVADNIKLQHEHIDLDYEEYEDEYEDEYYDEEESKKEDEEESTYLENAKNQIKGLKNSDLFKKVFPNKEKIHPIDFSDTNKLLDKVQEVIKEEKPKKPKKKKDEGIKPIDAPRGWHLRNEFIDNNGNVFKKGKYSHKDGKLKKA